jgi:hypothetical protein
MQNNRVPTPVWSTDTTRSGLAPIGAYRFLIGGDYTGPAKSLARLRSASGSSGGAQATSWRQSKAAQPP